MISFDCEVCDSRLQVEDEYAGARVRCPHCGQVNVVPKPDAKPKAGRQWKREDQLATPRGEGGGLPGILDGIVARLSAPASRARAAHAGPLLHQLAAFAAVGLAVGAVVMAIAQSVELLMHGSGWGGGGLRLEGLLETGGWLGVVVRLAAGLLAALVGYMFAASGCGWLKRETVAIHDPTLLRAATLFGGLTAAAMLVAVVWLAIQTQFAVAGQVLVLAGVTAFVTFIFYNPGPIGVAVEDGAAGSRLPVFATGLGLFETLAKLALMLGVVGFVLGGLAVLIGWVGGALAMFLPGGAARRFGVWAAALGHEGVWCALVLPAAGYGIFFLTRLYTGLARAVLLIADSTAQEQRQAQAAKAPSGADGRGADR